MGNLDFQVATAVKYLIGILITIFGFIFIVFIKENKLKVSDFRLFLFNKNSKTTFCGPWTPYITYISVTAENAEFSQGPCTAAGWLLSHTEWKTKSFLTLRWHKMNVSQKLYNKINKFTPYSLKVTFNTKICPFCFSALTSNTPIVKNGIS